ncbi:MAG: hypothetical protein ACI9UJ_002015, partial [bacterium]
MFQPTENKDFVKVFGLRKILLFGLFFCFATAFAGAEHEE